MKRMLLVFLSVMLVLTTSPQPSRAEGGCEIILEEGINFLKFCARHSLDAGQIARMNSLPGNWAGIEIKGRVLVPCGSVNKIYQTYIVKEGDTLSQIAKSFGVTIGSILAVNGLSDARIYPGQPLTIHSGVVGWAAWTVSGGMQGSGTAIVPIPKDDPRTHIGDTSPAKAANREQAMRKAKEDLTQCGCYVRPRLIGPDGNPRDRAVQLIFCNGVSVVFLPDNPGRSTTMFRKIPLPDFYPIDPSSPDYCLCEDAFTFYLWKMLPYTPNNPYFGQ